VFPSLIPRKKWNVERRNVRVGDFVMVESYLLVYDCFRNWRTYKKLVELRDNLLGKLTILHGLSKFLVEFQFYLSQFLVFTLHICKAECQRSFFLF